MAGTHRGACLCGAIEIEATAEPVEMGYCHCSSCRAHSGAPLSSYILWRDSDVRVIRGAEHLGRFNKTGKTERGFCTRCGSKVMNAHPGFGFSDVPAAMLPTVTFRPSVHLNYAETVLRIPDGLPKLKDFPVEAGGSGETLPE